MIEIKPIAWTVQDQLDRVARGEVGFIARLDTIEPAPDVPLYDKATVDTLRRDAERLNWLDANGFTAYRQIDPIDGLSGHCVVVHETMKPRRGNVADGIREAIDAAMQGANARIEPNRTR